MANTDLGAPFMAIAFHVNLQHFVQTKAFTVRTQFSALIRLCE